MWKASDLGTPVILPDGLQGHGQDLQGPGPERPLGVL